VTAAKPIASVPPSLRGRLMAETVYLNDGSMEVIFEDKDVFLERLLREKLGDDVARCFRECVAELKEKIQEQQELVKDYEGNADGYLDMCRDACESFTAIMELLEAPRLNRNALKSVTRNAFNAIYKNL
jgi:hypothetical protein